MAVKDIKELTGMEKAGILMIAMGTDVAAQVFRHLSEPEIERLSAQIIKMRDVEPSVVETIFAEFEQICAAAPSSSVAGKDFAAQVLEQVVGGEKAIELLDKAATPGFGKPFESLWDLSSAQLTRILSDEHPQVIALVLTHLPSEKAASVLSECSEETQGEVSRRICTMEETDLEVIRAIEEALQTRLSTAGAQVTQSGGPKTLVEILNNATRSTERNVLESLAVQDPDVGEQVRRMMFVYEDLPKLEDRTVQVVLREVDQEDLRMALKGSTEEIKELVFKNMSERAAEMLKEDLELLSSARAQDIEAAQQKIVSVVRRLLASGEAMMKSEDGQSGGETESQPGEEQVVEQSDQAELAA